MTCRDEILAAFAGLERRHARREFDLVDVVQEVRSRAAFEESTIRTHITSRMCANAPANHETVYADLERVSRSRYRRQG